jgi:formylglycine-generating enzyme
METMKRWLFSVMLLGCQGEPVVEVTADSSTSETAAIDSASPVDTGTPIGDAPVADSGDSGAHDPQCGMPKGGPMVYAGSSLKFCIDAREVTRGDYDVFVKATAGSKPAQPPYCDWNDTFDPLSSPFGDDFPITGIDWCDALAYCKWADKQLCGALDTGEPTFEYSAGKTMWSLACANGDGTATTGWATGMTAPAAGVCQIGGLMAPAPVNAHANCRGEKAPWDRVRDMVGNVAEWDAAGCFVKGFDAGTTPMDRKMIDCGIRGGFYGNDIATGQCFNNASRPIDTRDASIGFRCCKKT